MRTHNNQKGMTAVGLMLLLACIAFVTLIALKIIPIYLDSFNVDDVLKTMKDERGLGDKPNSEMVRMIMKRLDINMVTDVTPEDIYIEKIKDVIIIEADYEVRKPMFGNLDVIVHFKKSVEASAI